MDNNSLKKKNDIFAYNNYTNALGIINSNFKYQHIGSLGYFVKNAILYGHNLKYNSCVYNLNEKCNSINMRSDCAANLTEIENDNGGNENE